MSKHFVIIGGHSTAKTGAVGSGYREEEENFFMADKIRWFLKDRWVCTVVNDPKTYHSGGGEEAFITKENPTYFLSVHFNAGGGVGSEMLVPINETVTILEENILKGMVNLGFKSRGVKRAKNVNGKPQFVTSVGNKSDEYYGIFRNTNGRSGAIIEICFIDNAEDMKLYKAKWRDIAIMIADEIGKAYGLTVNANSESRKPSTPSTSTPTPPTTTVSKVEYDKVVSELNALKKDMDTLKNEKDNLETERDELKVKVTKAIEVLK